MTFYGTFASGAGASGAGWIMPKNYVESVGPDGFKKHPIGLGPYKFVSSLPGAELVMRQWERAHQAAILGSGSRDARGRLWQYWHEPSLCVPRSHSGCSRTGRRHLRSHRGHTVSHDMDDAAHRYPQVCPGTAQRRQQRRRRNLRPDGAWPIRSEAQRARAPCPRDCRCRLLVRRCSDHPGHFGAVSGRGTKAHCAPYGKCGGPHHPAYPRASVYRSSARYCRRRAIFRADHVHLVCSSGCWRSGQPRR